MTISVVVDNIVPDESWVKEHGLALWIEFTSGVLLFDTGAGKALLPNLSKLALPVDRIRWIVLSHGHNDHTGGLKRILDQLPNAEVYFGEGMENVRYSSHDGWPVKKLTIPDCCLDGLKNHDGKLIHAVRNFTHVNSDFSLTGGIPRRSFETTGGPFYFDPGRTKADPIADEIALLTPSGVLVQGCCHAGIINTVEHCREQAPDIPIHTIIGGLHLLYASEERLAKTAEYLNGLPLKKLILLHCTGENAVAYLKEHVKCEVVFGKTGDCYHG